MKSVLMDKRIVAACMGLLCATMAAPRSYADDTVVPSKTTVLILPTVDTCVEGAHFAGLHTAVVTHRLEYEFLERQFRVIGPVMAKAAATKVKVDLTDPTLRTTDTLKKMADATKADWVVSMNVMEVKHDTMTPGNRTDHSKMHLLVYDAKNGEILADKDVLKTSNSAGQNIGVLGLMIQTMTVTTQYAVKNLLSPYPEVVKVDDESGADDYLFNQTAPVTGDPKKIFTSLGAPPPSTGAVQLN